MLLRDDLAEIGKGAFDEPRYQVELWRMEKNLAAVGRDNHLNRSLSWQDARQFGEGTRRDEDVAAWMVVSRQRGDTHRQAEGIGRREGNFLIAHLYQHTCQDGARIIIGGGEGHLGDQI